MYIEEQRGNNCELLFFILIYLLLFYDSSSIGILRRGRIKRLKADGTKDCTLLLFILVFLLLFY